MATVPDYSSCDKKEILQTTALNAQWNELSSFRNFLFEAPANSTIHIAIQVNSQKKVEKVETILHIQTSLKYHQALNL